jgi:hypothetical protein
MIVAFTVAVVPPFGVFPRASLPGLLAGAAAEIRLEAAPSWVARREFVLVSEPETSRHFDPAAPGARFVLSGMSSVADHVWPPLVTRLPSAHGSVLTQATGAAAVVPERVLSL